ncbi:hypothetical protein [Thermococcus sp. 2319x1]|uniref:hypothetical protein n=1 Tax=Thermococcus sp. 2319x1 TaxID=1674923 RepID=UPI00118770EA|nr:hypothetical protein [Thermococcus sp. 2319x1]
MLAFGIVFLVFVIVPESQGVSAKDSPQLYSLHIDWLQGKPVGLVNFHVIPSEKVEDAILMIVDYNVNPPKVFIHQEGCLKQQ